MGRRAPEFEHTLNRLHSDIEQRRQTIGRLKSLGHVTLDAGRNFDELIASARVMESAPQRDE